MERLSDTTNKSNRSNTLNSWEVDTMLLTTKPKSSTHSLKTGSRDSAKFKRTTSPNSPQNMLFYKNESKLCIEHPNFTLFLPSLNWIGSLCKCCSFCWICMNEYSISLSEIYEKIIKVIKYQTECINCRIFYPFFIWLFKVPFNVECSNVYTIRFQPIAFIEWLFLSLFRIWGCLLYSPPILQLLTFYSFPFIHLNQTSSFYFIASVVI